MPYTPIEPAIPSDQDTVRARELSRALEQHGADQKVLRVQIAAAGQEVTTLDLPPVVARLLMNILKETAAGHAVTLVPFEAETASGGAAECLTALCGRHDRQGHSTGADGRQSASAAVEGRARLQRR
jgi:hypothetical protein